MEAASAASRRTRKEAERREGERVDGGGGNGTTSRLSAIAER